MAGHTPPPTSTNSHFTFLPSNFAIRNCQSHGRRNHKIIWTAQVWSHEQTQIFPIPRKSLSVGFLFCFFYHTTNKALTKQQIICLLKTLKGNLCQSSHETEIICSLSLNTRRHHGWRCVPSSHQLPPLLMLPSSLGFSLQPHGWKMLCLQMSSSAQTGAL